ncbi:MAG: hypothetical protein QOG72_1920 [Sphingomonadales bacterium]|jgi:hypothetical protein|nr:hypothetical protein [Sphingomonadales bacterium]
MKIIWLGLAAAAGGVQPQSAPRPRVITTTRVEPVASCKDMNWLAGEWRTPNPPPNLPSSRRGPPIVEEYWMPEAEGLMLGLGRTVTGAGRPSFEYMRIERDRKGAIRFYGSPEGGPAVAFRLVVCSPGWMTFQNADHDYPQNITYRREGDVLTASVAMLDGSRRQTVRYDRR